MARPRKDVREEVHDLGQQLWGTEESPPDEEKLLEFEVYCKAEVAKADALRAEEEAVRAANYDAWRAAGGVHNGG